MNNIQANLDLVNMLGCVFGYRGGGGLSKSIVLFLIRIQVADLFGKIKIKSSGF